MKDSSIIKILRIRPQFTIPWIPGRDIIQGRNNPRQRAGGGKGEIKKRQENEKERERKTVSYGKNKKFHSYTQK